MTMYRLSESVNSVPRTEGKGGTQNLAGANSLLLYLSSLFTGALSEPALASPQNDYWWGT